MATIYRDWKVGDIINICASIDEFCGIYSQFIFAKDINVTKSPDSCNPSLGYERGCGLHLNNVEFTFKLVKISGSVEGKTCNPQQVYKTIGTARTNSNGVARIIYTITDQDRLDYLSASGSGTPYKVIACITNPDGQSLESGQRSVVSDAITVSPGIVATHYLDMYVKPYSWYTPGGAADWIIGKSTDISGALYNLFTGITDYQYLGTEISSTITPGYVTIRIKVRQISSIGGNGVQSLIAPALLAAIADIIVKLLIIVIIVGVITGWKFTLAGLIEQISGKKYTTTEVIEIVDKVKDAQLDECNRNYTDPNTASGCQKAVVCGAADGLSDALSITGADCDTLGINQKVNDCLSQYNIDHDKTKYDACVLAISKDATTEAKDKAPKETDWGSILLWGGIGVVALIVITRK